MTVIHRYSDGLEYEYSRAPDGDVQYRLAGTTDTWSLTPEHMLLDLARHPHVLIMARAQRLAVRSWCHQENGLPEDGSSVSCSGCGHDARLPRMLCVRRLCDRQRRHDEIVDLADPLLDPGMEA